MSALSPRTKLSPAEKKASDEQYVKNNKKIRQHVSQIHKAQGGLVRLACKFATDGAPGYEFPPETVTSKDGKVQTFPRVVFTKADLAYYKAKIGALIKDFANYHRCARKRPRRDPGQTNLTSVYTPVAMGPSLLTYFSTPGVLGYQTPGVPFSGDLWAALSQYAKSGFVLRNTINSFFWVATYNGKLQDPNNGQFIRPNKAFEDAFGRQPSLYQLTRSEEKKGKAVNKKSPNTTKASTYDVLRNLGSHEGKKKDKDGKPEIIVFKPEAKEGIRAYFFQQITSANVYESKDPNIVDQITRVKGDKSISDQLMADHNKVKECREKWKAILLADALKRKASKKAGTAK